MDPNWQDAPESERYKHALFFAKDGNFVLSHHQKKLDPNDVSLFNGAVYYGDNEDYEEFKSKFKDDNDMDREVEHFSFPVDTMSLSSLRN